LPDALEEVSYTVGAVNLEELLLAVGKHLQQARLDRKWKVTDVQQAGGPSYKTVQVIEEGQAGHIESLEKCAHALDLSIVDVLFTVLAERETPLSPEAARLVRAFTEAATDGRMALLAMATALLARSPTGTPPTPDGAAGPAAPRRSRPGPRGIKRRSDA
jgi:hypothetical protein